MSQIKNWRSSWQALKDATKFCQDRWGAIAWLIFWQVVVTLVVVLLLSSTGEGGIYASAYGVGGSTAIQGIASVLAFVFSVFYTMTITGLLVNPKERSLLKVINKEVFPRFFGGIALMLLWGIALFIGGLALFLPGLILYTYWQFVVQAYVLDRTSVKGAFQSSFSFVRGWWWPVFGRVVALVALVTFTSFFSIIPGTGLVVSVILSLITSPIALVYIGQTYGELKKAKQVQPKSGMSVLGKLMLLFWAIVTFTLFSLVTVTRDYVVDVMFVTDTAQVDGAE